MDFILGNRGQQRVSNRRVGVLNREQAGGEDREQGPATCYSNGWGQQGHQQMLHEYIREREKSLTSSGSLARIPGAWLRATAVLRPDALFLGGLQPSTAPDSANSSPIHLLLWNPEQFTQALTASTTSDQESPCCLFFKFLPWISLFIAKRYVDFHYFLHKIMSWEKWHDIKRANMKTHFSVSYFWVPLEAWQGIRLLVGSVSTAHLPGFQGQFLVIHSGSCECREQTQSLFSSLWFPMELPPTGQNCSSPSYH